MASVVYLIRSVWTSSCLLSTSTSNLPCFLFPFGLQHTFAPLQRPICRACSSILDFLVTFLCFNVQSTVFSRPFWTFSWLPSASTSNLSCLLVPFWTSSCRISSSTSNPPRNIVPFGLQHTFPPLQRPIRRACPSVRLPSGP